MFTIIDRYLLRSLLANYVIALAAMLSLYVVLDMFINMDEFTEHGHPPGVVLRHLASYYWPNLFLYFAQLAGAITVFSALATLSRLRRQNELTAVLASGVSLYRVAVPIVLFGIGTTGVLIADTEWFIPAIAHKLARDHDDADGQRTYQVLFLPDRGGALFSAGWFHPDRRDLQRLLVLIRDEQGVVVQTLEADAATWVPPDDLHPDGRWRLERGKLTTRQRTTNESPLAPRESKSVTYPTEYVSDLSPEAIQLRQSEGWIGFLSLKKLSELEQQGGTNLAAVLQTKHTRRTAPVMCLVLLLLGLPFFLDRSPATVLNDAGRSMIACGLCYGSTIISQSIRAESGSALPVWLPVLVFGTLAVVLLDRVRT